jgi:hypothetical protein
MIGVNEHDSCCSVLACAAALWGQASAKQQQCSSVQVVHDAFVASSGHAKDVCDVQLRRASSNVGRTFGSSVTNQAALMNLGSQVCRELSLLAFQVLYRLCPSAVFQAAGVFGGEVALLTA